MQAHREAHAVTTHYYCDTACRSFRKVLLVPAATMPKAVAHIEQEVAAMQRT